MSSTEMIRANLKDAVSPAPNGAASGSATVCCRDRRSMASCEVRGSFGVARLGYTQRSITGRLP